MYFQDGDVVVELRLNVDVADLASAVQTCQPLVAELGVAAVEVETADPDGGRRGFHVSLIVVSPGGDGPAGAMTRRAAGPLLARFGLAERWFEDGEYTGPDRKSDACTVTSLTATIGRDAAAAYQDGPYQRHKVLAVPCQEDEVVARVHTRAADLGSALEQLGDARAVEVHPDGDGYAVALFFVLDGDQGLRHAAQPLIDRFGLDATRYTEHERSAWTVGAIETAPAGDGAHALYVRQAIDPFSSYDAFAPYEPEELVVRNALTDDEAADLAALLRDE